MVCPRKGLITRLAPPLAIALALLTTIPSTALADTQRDIAKLKNGQKVINRRLSIIPDQ